MTLSLSSKLQDHVLVKNELAQIIIGTLLVACAAQISIPLKPVPITMQSVAVLLIGLFYSKKQAIKTILTYLGLGIVGFPVFANFQSGIFVGPTAGYLWGFLGCVVAMTTFREKVQVNSYLMQFVCCVIGSAITFVMGISWLALFVGWQQAVMLGFVPFIIPGIVKACIVSYATKHIHASPWL